MSKSLLKCQTFKVLHKGGLATVLNLAVKTCQRQTL